MKLRAGFGHKLQKISYATLDFGEFVKYFNGQNSPNSEPLKMALFGTLSLPKLISRKIWVGGNPN